MATLPEVRDLRTYFFTQAGVVKAVNGISYALEEGETLGLVGESGCGKSVSALSIMRLVPDPPGKTVGGEVIFAGRDLLKLPDSEIRRVRGKQIAMVYQEPMTSLNPVLSIERQLTESLELHLRMTKAEARREAVRRLEQVGIPDPERRLKQFPHQFSGGMLQRVMIAIAPAATPSRSSPTSLPLRWT
jgi:oligopeptide transport system ATP-binding protein